LEGRHGESLGAIADEIYVPEASLGDLLLELWPLSTAFSLISRAARTLTFLVERIQAR
jgi:hypothetical protein